MISSIISEEKKINCYNKKYEDKVIPFTKNTNNIENQNETGNSNNGKDYYSNINNMSSFLKTYKPKFFEDFELIEFINNGSVGYVYRGNVKKSKKPIAIKFIMNDNRKDKKDQKRSSKKEFCQEFEINRKLHNPHINEVYALTRINNDSYFCIIEHGKYGDLANLLKNLLKRKSLTETSLDYFGPQILKGLEHMHKCKVLHLDIKPGNILIDSNLNAKLTDFQFLALMPHLTLRMRQEFHSPVPVNLCLQKFFQENILKSEIVKKLTFILLEYVCIIYFSGNFLII